MNTLFITVHDTTITSNKSKPMIVCRSVRQQPVNHMGLNVIQLPLTLFTTCTNLTMDDYYNRHSTNNHSLTTPKQIESTDVRACTDLSAVRTNSLRNKIWFDWTSFVQCSSVENCLFCAWLFSPFLEIRHAFQQWNVLWNDFIIQSIACSDM